MVRLSTSVVVCPVGQPLHLAHDEGVMDEAEAIRSRADHGDRRIRRCPLLSIPLRCRVCPNRPEMVCFI